MDALALLTADHDRFRGFLARLGTAGERGDDAAQRALAGPLFRDLEIHAALEEELLYPWVRGLSEELATSVDEGAEEHHVADLVIAEARALGVGGDQWEAKLTVLMENVEHHIAEEEDDMFPGVRQATSAEDREAVGARMDARRGDLGGPTLAEAMRRGADELRDKAAEQQIPGRSSMSKEELAAAVDPRA